MQIDNMYNYNLVFYGMVALRKLEHPIQKNITRKGVFTIQRKRLLCTLIMLVYYTKKAIQPPLQPILLKVMHNMGKSEFYKEYGTGKSFDKRRSSYIR